MSPKQYGAAPVAEWSKVLPQTACCVLPLPVFESWSIRACEKVTSDLGLGGGFDGTLVSS